MSAYKPFLLLLPFLSLVHASEVVAVSQSTFESTVGSEKLMMLEFYAPWCGHCQSLEPEYKKAAQKLGDTAKLGAVDATQNSQLASKYSVSGYPTLKLFREGKAIKTYNGPRDSSGIVSFMQKEAAKSPEEVQKDLESPEPEGPGDMGDYPEEDYYGDGEGEEDYDDADDTPREEAEPRGAFELDEVTFQKLHVGYDMVVRFSEQYSYDAQETEYAKLSYVVAEVPFEQGKEFLLGTFSPAWEDETTSYKNFLKQFSGVKKDALPVYKFFKKGRPLSEQKTYSGKFEVLPLSSWIKSVSGVWLPVPGCVERFDAMAATYLEADKDKRQTLQNKLTTEVTKLEGVAKDEKTEAELAATSQTEATAGKQYLKAMKKIDEKGEGYLEKEKTRIGKIVEGDISEAKKTELEHKVNILSSFERK